MLSALALAATGCSSDEGLRADEAATVGEGSTVEFSVDGEDWNQRGAGGAIPAGAQVRSTGDEARLTFRGGRVRLSSDGLATVTNDEVTLERGEALVANTADLRVTVEDTTVTGVATYRVATGLAARVGVYQGEVAVRRPAQKRSVPALRQLDLTEFRLAAAPSPLQYVRSDAWDRGLLGAAIAFDAEAARLSRGMDLEFGTALLPRRLYSRFTTPTAVPVLAATATLSEGPAFGPPSDVLLTFFVARAAGAGDLGGTIREVAGLRSAGARWGLIAMDLGVPADDVVAAINSLGDRRLALDGPGFAGPNGEASTAGRRAAGSGGDRVAVVDAADGTGATGTSADPGPGDSDPTGGGDDPAPPPPDDKNPGGGGGEPPPPPPPEGPVDTVVNGVVEQVGETGNEDLGGNAPLPEELEAVGDIIDPDN